MTDDRSAWRTRASLLERIRDRTDEQSWDDFVHYYRPFIYNVVRGMHIAHHDAEEIVQTVLLKSWNKLPEFEYNRGKGRFRGWLCQVTGNAVRDFIRKKKHSLESTLAEAPNETNFPHFTDLPEIDKIMEKEWKSYISKLAWEAVSKRFQPHVATAFLRAVQAVPVADIVKELGIAESSVYVYKSRVQKELRAEIVRLNRLLG